MTRHQLEQSLTNTLRIAIGLKDYEWVQDVWPRLDAVHRASLVKQLDGSSSLEVSFTPGQTDEGLIGSLSYLLSKLANEVRA